jgi:hypothetical protein
MKLAELGNVFDTKHRKLEFDHHAANQTSIQTKSFRDKLLKYLHNDLLCLLESIQSASTIILNLFNVDLSDSYSTSSLAFRVFRTKFLSKDGIPTLPRELDSKNP